MFFSVNSDEFDFDNCPQVLDIVQEMNHHVIKSSFVLLKTLDLCLRKKASSISFQFTEEGVSKIHINYQNI